MREITFTHYTGKARMEHEHALPAKAQVCGTCEGHGTVLTPSIANHAYTLDEFVDSFDEDERREYLTRGGRYDVQCPDCRGARVVDVVDAPSAVATLRGRRVFAIYQQLQRREASDRRQLESWARFQW